MKIDIRWQLLLALAGFGLVAALLSYQVSTAGICSVRVPASGAVYAEGLVGSPRYLNPLLANENPVDRELVSLIFDGLTGYENGELVPVLAERWEISDDGRTVRFFLRDGIRFHDGQALTAEDVAFTYGLMQEEEFTGDPALQRLWQSVTIRPLDDTTIEFELLEPYGGFLEATTMGIMPAHLLDGVTAETLPDTLFNRQPVGTGPFMVQPGQDWQQTHELRLTPNPESWRQGLRTETVAFRFYPDEAGLLEAFVAGEIEAINSVSPVMLPEVARIPEARLFSAVAPRYTSLLFNLSESGSPAVRSADVRRALAYGLDRHKLVDQTLNGQGVVHTGPYLPSSWAHNGDALTLFSSEPISATTGLEAAGWTLAEGASTREKDGEALVLRLLAHNSPTNQALAEAIEAQWIDLGVTPLLQLYSDRSEFRQALRQRAFDVALVEVAPAGDPDLYDFWSQEAIIRGQNYASWNDRRASEALESGRRLWAQDERRPFYDTFLRYYNEALPELALFQHVYTYAVNEAVEGYHVGRIDTARDRYVSLPDWILLYRDVSVACPEDGGQLTPQPSPAA